MKRAVTLFVVLTILFGALTVPVQAMTEPFSDSGGGDPAWFSDYILNAYPGKEACEVVVDDVALNNMLQTKLAYRVGTISQEMCEHCEDRCRPGDKEYDCPTWEKVCDIPVFVTIGWALSEVCKKLPGWARAGCFLLPIQRIEYRCRQVETIGRCSRFHICAYTVKDCWMVPCGD